MKTYQVQGSLNPALVDGSGSVNLWNMWQKSDAILRWQNFYSTNNVQDFSWVVYVPRK
jgi:hypothetical protein